MERIKEQLICPFTLQIFFDPVVTNTRITYERSVLEAYLFKTNVCPVTKHKITGFFPSLAIRNVISELLSSNFIKSEEIFKENFNIEKWKETHDLKYMIETLREEDFKNNFECILSYICGTIHNSNFKEIILYLISNFESSFVNYSKTANKIRMNIIVVEMINLNNGELALRFWRFLLNIPLFIKNHLHNFAKIIENCQNIDEILEYLNNIDQEVFIKNFSIQKLMITRRIRRIKHTDIWLNDLPCDSKHEIIKSLYKRYGNPENYEYFRISESMEFLRKICRIEKDDEHQRDTFSSKSINEWIDFFNYANVRSTNIVFENRKHDKKYKRKWR